jgi:hypothetical protein
MQKKRGCQSFETAPSLLYVNQSLDMVLKVLFEFIYAEEMLMIRSPVLQDNFSPYFRTFL